MKKLEISQMENLQGEMLIGNVLVLHLCLDWVLV